MASEAAKAIEAILMVAQEPVDPHLLAQVLEVAPARVSELCAELQASYEAEDRGFVLVKVAGEDGFQSHGDLAPTWSASCWKASRPGSRRPLLETLAIWPTSSPSPGPR